MQKVIIKKDLANIAIINLPDSWEEVTFRQYKQIFPILFDTFPAPPAGKVMAMIVKKFVPKKIFKLLDAFHIWDIGNCIRFMWATVPPVAWFPKFRFRFTNYYLPSSYLKNITYFEFMCADAFLAAIANDESIASDNLDKLVATLCRPSKWFWFIRKQLPKNDGDIRQPFNFYVMEQRAKRFKRLPLRWKMYVLAFFVACKKDIIEDPTYHLVFPAPKKKDYEEYEGGGWIQLLYDVANTKIYGNYDETANYSLHTILTNLQSELARQEKVKVKTKKK